MTATQTNNQRSTKKFLNSPFILTILSAISTGKRPSQIARSRGMSEQDVYYYTKKLRELNFIQKVSTRQGCVWSLTEKGDFYLKEKLRRSVGGYPHSMLPFRYHNVRFKFQVRYIPDSLALDWKLMENGVQKATLRDQRVEIIKTPNEWKSSIIISMPSQYFTNRAKADIKLYNDAQRRVMKIAEKLSLEVSQYGEIISSPHMAFERDIGALFIANQTTASIETSSDGEGKAWVDGSNGAGELETDDPDYALQYLMMPQKVFEVHDILTKHRRTKASAYAQHYHPVETMNN